LEIIGLGEDTKNTNSAGNLGSWENGTIHEHWEDIGTRNFFLKKKLFFLNLKLEIFFEIIIFQILIVFNKNSN
jgi:hypothetical protein